MSKASKWLDWVVSLFNITVFSIFAIIFFSKVKGRHDLSVYLTIGTLFAAFIIKFGEETYERFSGLQEYEGVMFGVCKTMN